MHHKPTLLASLLLCSLALLHAAPTQVQAWGHTGHALTARISMQLLSETTKQHLRQLLPEVGGDLSQVSSWADEVKRTARFSHTGPLHYSDAHDDPPHTCSYIFARDCPDGNCVTAAIKQFTAILVEHRDHGTLYEYDAETHTVDELDEDEIVWIDVEQVPELDKRHLSGDEHASAFRRGRKRRQRRPPKGRRQPRRPPRRAPGNGRRSRRPPTPRPAPPSPNPPTGSPPKTPEIVYTPTEALKFLVHLVQDVHQPMHLTGKLRGGNDQPALFGRQHSNLHAVWDSLMLEKAIKDEYAGDMLAMASALLAKVQSGEWKGDAGVWTTCPAPKAPKPVEPEPPVSSVGEQVAMQAPTAFSPRRAHATTPMLRLLTNPNSDPATPLPPLGAIDKLLCPEFWAQGIDTVNCSGVWDKFHEGEDLSGAYYEANAGTVVKLVAMGGVRLAAVLEAVFNPEMRP